MATTTPNFGWAVPTSSDLVKNGATAIETLGDAIDASMVDLKGGTTGQVLSKASNTDMDFTWSTASGGSNLFYAGKNKIINGDFYVNQRGFTSTTTTDTYGFDRWYTTNSDGTVTSSAQTFTAGTAPVAGYEGANYLRQVTTGQTSSTASARIVQGIENVRTFAGQTATLSFWAKAASGTPKIAIELTQAFGSGGSPSSDVNTYAGQVTLSTSWARVSVTVAIPSLSGKTVGTTANTSQLLLRMWTSAGTTFNSRTGSLGIQSNTFDIWGVQLEAGSSATDFQTATGTIQGELAACQRYYFRVGGDSDYQTLATGCIVEGTVVLAGVQNPVPMRVKPTSVDSSTLAVYDGSTLTSVTSVTLNLTSKYISRVNLGLASSPTTNRPYWLFTYNSLSGYIGFSAEL